MSKTSGILLLVVSVFVVLFWCFVETIPPEGTARSNMQALRSEIFTYIHREGHLPERLDDVLQSEDERDVLNDGWGRPIEYHFDDASGSVSLTSRGKDGDKGGEGPNRDLRRSFETRNTDGTWKQDTDDMWLDSGEIIY